MPSFRRLRHCITAAIAILFAAAHVAIQVDVDSDHVEAPVTLEHVVFRSERLQAEGHAAQLPTGDRLFGRLEVQFRPRLYFDCNEVIIVFYDQIDLARLEAVVAREDSRT